MMRTNLKRAVPWSGWNRCLSLGTSRNATIKPLIKANQAHIRLAQAFIGQQSSKIWPLDKISQLVEQVNGQDNIEQEMKALSPSTKASGWKQIAGVQIPLWIQNKQIGFDCDMPLNLRRFLAQSPSLQTRVLLAILMMDPNAFNTNDCQKFDVNILQYSGNVGTTFTEKPHTDSYRQSVVMGIAGVISQTNLYFRSTRWYIELPVKREGRNEAIVFPQKQAVSLNELGINVEDSPHILVNSKEGVRSLTPTKTPDQFRREIERIKQERDRIRGIVEHRGWGDSKRTVLNVSQLF